MSLFILRLLCISAFGISLSCMHGRRDTERSNRRICDDRWLLYSSNVVIIISESGHFRIINDYRNPEISKSVNEEKLYNWIRSSTAKKVSILLPKAWEERNVISKSKIEDLVKAVATKGTSVHLLEESSSGVWEVSKPTKKSNLIKDYITSEIRPAPNSAGPSSFPVA